jgi:hypothetical protein
MPKHNTYAESFDAGDYLVGYVDQLGLEARFSYEVLLAAFSAGGGWDGDITDMDIDGADDIGEDLEDGDLIAVDNGADGTNRKAAMSRVRTYTSKCKTASYASDQTLTTAE